MPRPKKIVPEVTEAPKRRGRPPKKLTAAAAPAAKEASKKPRKYSQPSTLTFRIDGKLRARLKKAARLEFTSESSLVNKYIDLGLSTEVRRLTIVDRRLAVIEKSLGITVAEPVDAADGVEADDLDSAVMAASSDEDGLDDHLDDAESPAMTAATDEDDVGDAVEDDEPIIATTVASPLNGSAARPASSVE